jgi:hypothetical protein
MTHGYYGGVRVNPSQMDTYEQVKEEVISDVWEFSIAQAQDYASTPELKDSLQELVYSISESILHNDKISKMYQDSKGKGAINAE